MFLPQREWHNPETESVYYLNICINSRAVLLVSIEQAAKPCNVTTFCRTSSWMLSGGGWGRSQKNKNNSTQYFTPD